MDSLASGLAVEDKVCESCGQIFSCEAAFLEHRKRNSCSLSRELIIEAPKGLRCPIQGCGINFATYEAIRRHHEAVHRSIDTKLKAQQEDGGPKRYDEESKIGEDMEKHLPSDTEGEWMSKSLTEGSGRWLTKNCPIVGCTYATKESRERTSEADLWSHIVKMHPDENIKVMEGEFKCSFEKCNWAGHSDEERIVHQRLYHGTILKRKLHIEENDDVKSGRSGKRCAIVKATSRAGRRGAVFGDDYDVVCCVQNCSMSTKMLKADGTPYEFFSFPKNTARLARWTAVANPRFPNFQPRPIDAICEKHFRKQDLLCAKPGLMDGADPHRDESLGEEDDEVDQSATTDKKESVGSTPGMVDLSGMNESLNTSASTKDSIPKNSLYSMRSNLNLYDRDALEFFSEDEDISAGEENSKRCCTSEIPVMKRRAKKMEKQCDALFLMLRTLLQSTHAEEVLRRKHEEEMLAAERINLTYPQITDFEARQMSALRALAESESVKAAQRIERKDSATDLYSNRRKEQIPSTSRSDDQLEVLVDEKTTEQSEMVDPNYGLKNLCKNGGSLPITLEREGDVRKNETTNKDRRKPRIAKGAPATNASLPESSNLPLAETPRIDEENAVILHPIQNRPLEKKEIRLYIARAILCLKTAQITKSRIRMLAPSWMQIADDADILAAVDELRSAGLLVLTGDAKTSKQKCDVYEKADWQNTTDTQAVLARYGLSSDMFEGGS